MTTLTMMEPGIRSFEQILKDVFDSLSNTQKEDALASIMNDEIPNSIVPGVALGIKLLLISGRNHALLNLLTEEPKST